jgi:flagellar biosynthesis protein
MTATGEQKPAPASIAVALDYQPGHTPRVVATGRGHVSDRIIEVAKAHGVPLQKDPALAAALSTLELDEEIPEQLYRAVAQVLGFILRAAGKLK